MSSNREAAKVKPYHFTKKIKDLEGEKWKNIRIKELLGCFKVSNFGRIKRLRHNHKGRTMEQIIMTPYRNLKHENEKYTIIIRKTNFCVQDLVFDSFVGLKHGYVSRCINGDRRNIRLDNLKQVKSTWKRIDTYLPKENTQKPLSVQIDINDGDKEANLLHINSMKGEGYCLKSTKNGVYFFELLPKEGDTVRVKNSQYIDKKTHKVTKKNGIKHELEGCEKGVYFLAKELEIIKQS